jgi:glycosyltransferase involved in cell wall biosynthesis
VRILFFSRDYTPHDHRFLSALAESEHSVYFLRLEQSGRPLEDRPLPSAIEQIQWSGGNKPVSLRQVPRLLFELQKIIQKVKPHLVHAGPIQRAAFLTAISGFRPLISMSWGYDLIQDANRDAWQRWATRFTLKNSAWLIGDCEAIRKIAITHGMPKERITTFPWGVDLNHFSPPSEMKTQKRSTFGETSEDEVLAQNPPFTLLSTRGWEPIYGVDILARAFVLAARERPELRLIMLGSGSQAGLIQKIFLEGGLLSSMDDQPNHFQTSRVLLPGQIGYERLPDYYRSADLYLAATHSDGASISLLEAMACGRPALVTDLEGNREWITPEENGWLFPEGDVQAMKQAILKAVEMRTLLPQMGEKARKIVEQRANWKNNFQKLLHVYQSVYTQYYTT